MTAVSTAHSAIDRCSTCAAASVSTAAVVLRTHSRSSAPRLALQARNRLQVVAKRLMLSSRNCITQPSKQGHPRRTTPSSVRHLRSKSPELAAPGRACNTCELRQAIDNNNRKQWMGLDARLGTISGCGDGGRRGAQAAGVGLGFSVSWKILVTRVNGKI